MLNKTFIVILLFMVLITLVSSAEDRSINNFKSEISINDGNWIPSLNFNKPIETENLKGEKSKRQEEIQAYIR